MLVGDAVSGLAEFGAIGVLALVVGGWFTWLGKWVIIKLTVMISDSNKVIQRNSDVMDSWKRTSGDVADALKQFNTNSSQCREGMEKALEIITRRCARREAE